MASKTAKITLLEEINKNKLVLFGPLTPRVTKQSKQTAWREVHATALSLGLVSGERNWSYTRDTVWPNLRKRALEKKDNARRTGTGGGKNLRMTEVDEKVIEILGKQSANVEGIGVSDTDEEVNLAFEVRAATEVLENENTDASTSTANPLHIENNVENPKKKRRSENSKWPTDDFANLKKKKLLLLEIEYLEKLNRKTSLEILKLEKELNIN